MKTADEVLKAIEDMENDERWKLLLELFYRHFNSSNLPRMEIDMEE
jgi:hypothetical protein